MDNDNKPPVKTDPVKTDPAKTDPAKTDPAKHWSSDLIAPELRQNAEVTKFEKLDDLANAYVKLSTQLASKTDVKPLDDNASYDDAVKTSEAMLNVKKEHYNENFKHKDLAFKHKLPAKLIEPLFKDLEENDKLETEKTRTSLLEKYREEISAKVDDKTLETRMDAGLKALGLTKNSYKELLPELERNKPALVLAIAELGKKQYTTKQQKILDDKDDSLPSDPDILRNMISELAGKQLLLSQKRQDTYHIDKELRNVKLKFKQITQNQQPKGLSF